MKIDIVTGPFMGLPPNSIGAVEKKWSLIAECWRRQGHAVKFHAVADDLGDVSLDRRNDYLAKYRQSSAGLINRAKDFHYALSVLRRLVGGDVLIINDFTLPFMAVILRNKYKVIVSSVERTPQFPIHKFQAGIDRFVGVSAAVIDAMKRFVPEKRWGRLMCVHNPIDVQRFEPVSLSESDDSVCYCGRIHPEKGVHHLAHAMRTLNEGLAKPMTLRLIGPWEIEKNGGGEGYFKSLKDVLGDALQYAGAFSDPADLAREIAKSRYFCYPSVARGESFGVAPVEAMALGRIVILSDLACFKDFAEDGRNSLIFSQDGDVVQNLAATLKKAVQLPEMHGTWSSAAAQTAHSFSVERIAESFMHVLETGLRERG